MREDLVKTRPAILWMVGAVVLVALAGVVPLVTGENVKVHFPPLHAWWAPAFVWRQSIPVIAIGIVLIMVLPRLAERLAWRWVVLLGFGASWLWTMAVAMTDGWHGLARVFLRRPEYLYDAKRVQDVSLTIHEFISRIPYSAAPDNWHTHVAGHPVGALLFFVGLVRVGIDTPLHVALACVVIGSTATSAALLTLRRLGSEQVARAALPWIVLAPWVVYMGVNGDAVFTAVSAWGLWLLAVAATTQRHRWAWSVAAGLVLGLCIFLSYGLVLLGILAIAVLVIARSWRPLPWAIGGALLMVAVFAWLGFAWWEAYPVLRERYYDGIASDRAYWYWVWADFAAWAYTLGFATVAAFAALKGALRDADRGSRVVAMLAISALATVTVASVSGMSKAEVERIWMPFTLWILPLAVFLPPRWRTPMLVAQVALTLVIQQLLTTRW